MKVSVKVPATTANIGPGFDCFGLALPIYNTITVEETVLPHSGIEINVLSDEEDIDVMSVPTDCNNIAYKAISVLYNFIGQEPEELRITIKSNIPIARGLGSSASVIVGALIAANELLGRPADEAALLSIATEVEGHPDNVTPAMVGGCVFSSVENDNSIVYRKMEFPSEWGITACVPDYELATSLSRAAIPAQVPFSDAIFNLTRVAMFVNALKDKDEELMKSALKDKLHQPYRQKYVPGFVEITEAMKYEENVLGCVLSGAGPTVLIITKDKKTDKIKQVVTEIWSQMNIKSCVKTLPVEQEGAVII